jgi:hypothetical protein
MKAASAPVSGAGPWRAVALSLVAAVAVVQGGCLSQSFEIRRTELARLAAVPPVLRGVRVAVEQELVASVVSPAPPVDERTVTVGVAAGALPRIHGGPAPLRRGPLGRGAAEGARATALAVLVLATFGVIIAATIESDRYEGTLRLHPMHPVHLMGRDGGYLVMPLAQIDPTTVQWTDRAVIRGEEGPFQYLERAPLRRRGLTYGLHFGVAQLSSGDGTHTSGPSSLLQFGYFPNHTVGILATAGFAWRENLVRYRFYEQRYGAEVQAMPLHAAIFHAGLYAGGGMAWRLEEGFLRGNDRSPTLWAGAQVQLDLNTHIALTARFGVYSGHERGPSEPMREATFGMSVY